MIKVYPAVCLWEYFNLLYAAFYAALQHIAMDKLPAGRLNKNPLHYFFVFNNNDHIMYSIAANNNDGLHYIKRINARLNESFGQGLTN